MNVDFWIAQFSFNCKIKTFKIDHQHCFFLYLNVNNRKPRKIKLCLRLTSIISFTCVVFKSWWTSASVASVTAIFNECGSSHRLRKEPWDTRNKLIENVTAANVDYTASDDSARMFWIPVCCSVIYILSSPFYLLHSLAHIFSHPLAITRIVIWRRQKKKRDRSRINKLWRVSDSRVLEENQLLKNVWSSSHLESNFHP